MGDRREERRGEEMVTDFDFNVVLGGDYYFREKRRRGEERATLKLLIIEASSAAIVRTFAKSLLF